jgi:hypothetical protein
MDLGALACLVVFWLRESSSRVLWSFSSLTQNSLARWLSSQLGRSFQVRPGGLAPALVEWLPGDVGGAEGLGQEDEHLVKKKMLMMMPMQETQPAFPPLLDEYDDEHSGTPHLGEFVNGLPG